MTDWRDTLLTISEIAIAIIGFTGLIAVLAHRQRIEVLSLEFLRLRSMLDYAVATLAGALLPFLIFSIGLSEPTSWRVSSCLMFGSSLTYMAVNRRHFSEQLTREGVTAWMFTFGDLIVLLLVLANCLGIFFEPNSLPYVSAVYWGLLGATVGFVRLVALVWTPSDTPPAD